MNFLPAIPMSAIPADKGCPYTGYGGFAVNLDGTRFASVDSKQHCVIIHSVDGAGEGFSNQVVFGTAGTPGREHGQLYDPRFACFVHRNGVDTLLICDCGNDRVVEVTANGVFLRAISLMKGDCPFGIAERDGVIAVSLCGTHAVVLLQYDSGTVTPDVTFGCGSGGTDVRRNGMLLNPEGHLSFPRGVSFTTDGCYLLVADSGNHRVSKFSATSGAFITHVISNGISYPRDVLQCEDGSLVVAQGGYCGFTPSVVCVAADGATVQDIVIPVARHGHRYTIHAPFSLSYSPSLNGVLVKTYTEGVFLLRDSWMASRRCAWLSALSCS